MSIYMEQIFEAEEMGWTVYQRELCELFLKDQPNDIEILQSYARSLIKLGLYDDADKVAQRALQVCSLEDRASIMLLRGDLFERNGLFLPARDIYIQAHNEQSEDSYFLIRAAICSREMGLVTESIEMSRASLETSGQWRKCAVWEVANGLAILRRYEEAFEMIQSHVQKFGSDEYFGKLLPDIEQVMAFSSLNESGPKRSSKVWIKQIEEAEESELVFVNREFCEAYLRDYPEENGRRIWVLATYCEILIELSLFDLAAEEIEKLEKMAPDDWSVMVKRGYLYDAMGDHQQAVTAYLRVAELPNAKTAPLIFAGSSMFNAGNLEAAIELTRRATQCPAGDLDEAYFNLAGYQLGLKRYAESKRCYKKALEIDPDAPFAKLRLEDLEKVFEMGKNG